MQVYYVTVTLGHNSSMGLLSKNSAVFFFLEALRENMFLNQVVGRIQAFVVD
jgi:hypothetical protein